MEIIPNVSDGLLYNPLYIYIKPRAKLSKITGENPK